jgi:hypothetical protein
MLKEVHKMTQPQVQPKPLKERLKQLKLPGIKAESLLLGGALVAAIGLTIAQNDVTPVSRPTDPSEFCQEIVQPKASVSREQLAQLLTVPERGDRAKVQAILKPPYCRMPSLSLRAKVITERDVYPLAADSQTWLVVLYEGKSYVGYGFKRS